MPDGSRRAGAPLLAAALGFLRRDFLRHRCVGVTGHAAGCVFVGGSRRRCFFHGAADLGSRLGGRSSLIFLTRDGQGEADACKDDSAEEGEFRFHDGVYFFGFFDERHHRRSCIATPPRAQPL